MQISCVEYSCTFSTWASVWRESHSCGKHHAWFLYLRLRTPGSSTTSGQWLWPLTLWRPWRGSFSPTFDTWLTARWTPCSLLVDLELLWMTLSSTCCTGHFHTWRALGVLWESSFCAFNTIQPSLLRGKLEGAWVELNHLCINASKTKEVVVDFRRKAPQTAPMNIQGLNIEIMEVYKYLGVHINNKLDWTHNTDVLYKKGQSHLHLLRRLRSFGVCRSLLKTFYDSVVVSAVFYAVVCWGCGSSERDRTRLNKLVKRAGSVLDCPLDSIEEVGERRMLSNLTSIMDNPSHPLQ